MCLPTQKYIPSTTMMNNYNTTPLAPELVIAPFPGKGHLSSTVEFANHLLRHHDKLSITILVIPPSSPSVPLPTMSHDRIKYIHLPRADPCPDFKYLLQVDAYKSHVKDAIVSILSRSASVRLIGVVIDMFCTGLIDVANEFHVPTYLFYTAGAGCLGFVRHIAVRYDSLGVPFSSDDDSDSIIPCYALPVPASSLPSFIFNEDDHSAFLGFSKRFLECKGIFLNTFVELDSYAVKSFLLGGVFPPVYTVGPLLNLANLERKKSSTVDDHEDKADKIMRWLDDQPSSTVVLLCFGSLGSFQDPKQLKEIALGLERTGHRFLWSVRRVNSTYNFLPPEDYTNYEEIMPEGFLERIGDRGMVCGWVPQVEVLSHRAVGGFVSHCGWNSILESLWFGVPIATWPMYSEQQLNAFQLVKELGLAVEVKLGYTMDGGDLVMADDIAKAVTCLMASDGKVRKKVKEMSEKSREAVMDGGSSYVSFQRLIKDMFQNISFK